MPKEVQNAYTRETTLSQNFLEVIYSVAPLLISDGYSIFNGDVVGCSLPIGSQPPRDHFTSELICHRSLSLARSLKLHISLDCHTYSLVVDALKKFLVSLLSYCSRGSCCLCSFLRVWEGRAKNWCPGPRSSLSCMQIEIWYCQKSLHIQEDRVTECYNSAATACLNS